MKPNYIFFYKSSEKLEELLWRYPFCEERIREKRAKDDQVFEYEHFDLRCYKRDSISKNVRGIKTWGIIIDKEIYDGLDQEIINDILSPMLSPCGALLGKIEVI